MRASASSLGKLSQELTALLAKDRG